jgi:hypothetical protein
MSKMSRFVQGYEEDTANLCAAMTQAQAKSIDDLEPEQIRRIMRRAMEAEQSADYREGVRV